MSTLKARLQQKERELAIERTRLRHQREDLVHAAGATLRSPQVVMSAAAVGLTLALLRCPGGSRRHRDYSPKSAGRGRGTLRWALRHLGPPITMALMHRAGGQASHD